MFKTQITTEDNRTIYLEYDNKEYDIEYDRSKRVIIVSFKGCDELATFSDKIGFLVQTYSNDLINFVVTDCSCENKIYLKHYVETIGGELKLIKKFECNSALIEKCRATDDLFIVEQEGYGGTVYSLNEKSKRFDYIHNDKKIKEIVQKKILLVSEKVGELPHSTDIITYGINSNFNIVTSIWSELQQRSIKIKNHTSEVSETIKRRELIGEKRHYLIPSRDRYMLDEATMDLEVGKYLNKLDKYLDKTERPFFDDTELEINEGFVKKLS